MLAMSPWLIFVFHHRTSGKCKTPVILITCIGLLGNVKRQLFQSSNVARMIKADSNGRSMLSTLRNSVMAISPTGSRAGAVNFDKAERKMGFRVSD